MTKGKGKLTDRILIVFGLMFLASLGFGYAGKYEIAYGWIGGAIAGVAFFGGAFVFIFRDK